MNTNKFLNVALAFCMMAGFAACAENKGKENETAISPDVVNNPATATSDTTNQQKSPVFTFEKDNHEFGQIVQGERVTYAFKFKNTGNAPLVISSASATCGCTVPEYTKTPVEAGEEGFINVTFDSAGKSGMTSKTVTLIANTVPNSKILTISADIQVPKEKI